MASDGSEYARHGSGTVRKGSEIRARASEAHSARPGSSPSLSPSLLSLGWEVANDGNNDDDDDDGHEFYYNANTGESRWDPPTPDAGDASPRPDNDGEEQTLLPEDGVRGGGDEEAVRVGDDDDDAESTPEDDAALRQPDALLPVGWEAVAVEDAGVYYHHVASGLTQWEAPHEGDGKEPIGDKNSMSVVALAGGSAGWEEFETEEGVPFWYNAATGESCWELPGDPAE